ncbi:uncharacterized protein [Antedon mediterranea]|uniref:uncharacterized protein n=1 Tax=Antedon mediterranea TaxID=105859 RepID=UPI003AF7FEBB
MYRGKKVDEHILNISSYRLSFFQKLALSRGLQFAYPHRVSSREIKANFEKAYWKLEPKIVGEETKELTAATLKSIALNYIERKGPSPPKALTRALGQLKKRDDVIITKPDKGSGVVVMDRSEYEHLLCEASVNNVSKFIPISTEQPRTRGRPMTHYHPLLKKEKDMISTVHKILPKEIAKSICQTGSRLAHLYGLPKTHKEKLSMRPILSATGTYNYKLAQWLDEKLKPLSQNVYTIDDVFSSAADIRSTVINASDILVDGVAMGSPLGPLSANVFMCHIEERLESTNHMPKYYKRYVDDTLVFMPNLEAANEFLALLNTTHPAKAFTMETTVNNSIPFLGMLITKDLGL